MEKLLKLPVIRYLPLSCCLPDMCKPPSYRWDDTEVLPEDQCLLQQLPRCGSQPTATGELLPECPSTRAPASWRQSLCHFNLPCEVHAPVHWNRASRGFPSGRALHRSSTFLKSPSSAYHSAETAANCASSSCSWETQWLFGKLEKVAAPKWQLPITASLLPMK